MLKLYRRSGRTIQYWETWANGDGRHTVHWGTLGQKGRSRTVAPTAKQQRPEVEIQKEVDQMVEQGFQPIDPDDHHVLVIEYQLAAWGSSEDLSRRHALEDRLNETLGWTGLGHCDGGSIGSGTMEVFCFVVDFEVAKSVVEKDLANSEYSDYARIVTGGDGEGDLP